MNRACIVGNLIVHCSSNSLASFETSSLGNVGEDLAAEVVSIDIGLDAKAKV